MTKILSIATAGLRADQIADINNLRFPRIDYIELQRLMNVETLDYSAYDKTFFGKYLRRAETQLRSDLYLGTLGWWKSHKYQAVFTWSERAGIPLAGYRHLFPSKPRFISMFQCWSKRQEIFITKLGLLSEMDDIIVHCDSMQKNLVRLGAPAEKVKIIRYSVDQCFFSPLPGVEPDKNLIVSVGEPRSRHYAALFQAVDGLPVNVKLPAYGHWYAREKNNRVIAPFPANVTRVRQLLQVELKELYARAQFIVLPIRDLVYSAGATATLEAGCMSRAVIAFRSRGITDYIIDGETGILVEPGNISAMRDAIQYLLANPKEAKRLGQNARQRIMDELNFESYVRNLANVIKQG